MHKIQNLKTIYVLSILFCIFLILNYGRQWGYDTNSYITAWDKISNFEIDIWRTPVYPIFIGTLKKLFGTYYLIAGVIIQHVTFLISIKYFFILSLYCTKKVNISWWLTAIYAIYPCIPTWNCFIQTEAFAIYSMVFMLYYAVKLYKEESYKYMCFFTFWLLFHIFLRPSQIYLLPIWGFGWAILFTKHKRNNAIATKGLLGVLMGCICMTYYTYCFKNTYGIWAPCGIGVLNKYCMLRKDHVFKEEDIQNHAFRNYIKDKDELYKKTKTPIDSVDLYKEAEYGIETYGLELVSNELSHSKQFTIEHSFRSLIKRWKRASNDIFLYTYLYKWTKLPYITDILGIRLNCIYCLLFIFPFILLHQNRQTKSFSWFSMILFLIAINQLSISIIACQDEWGRLILPAISVYLIIIGQICSSIILSRDQNFIFE